MLSALRLQRSIPVREAAIGCCEWSPSGRMIAVGLQSGVIEVIALSGKKLFTVKVGDSVQAISWSPNEKLLGLATARNRLLIVEARPDAEIRELTAHTGGVWCVAFSPSGDEIASGGEDGRIAIWSVGDGWLVHTMPQRDEILSLAWINDNELVACNNAGEAHIIKRRNPILRRTLKTNEFDVRVTAKFGDVPACVSTSETKDKLVFGSKTGAVYISSGDLSNFLTLEGHTGWVWSVSFALEDTIVVSESQDGTVRFWDSETGSLLAGIRTAKAVNGNVSVHPKLAQIAIPNDQRKVLEIAIIDAEYLRSIRIPAVTQYCSAKIALVGESNVGKSCLALRLAENKYQETGTTHGMRFWPVAPERLDLGFKPTPNQKRDIVLWDMGGQDEYRLIHQLFLHDTTVAMVLLDPTRGRTALEEAEGWAKRLERQISGRQSAKLLVGTKLDGDTDLIDKNGLDRLIKEQGFEGYYPTSAKTGRGLPELGKAMMRVLDWDALARTTRPKLFQTVRNEIERARSQGEIVLLRKDLEQRVKKLEDDFDTAAVGTVVSQLALQGLISVTRLSSGESALVLHVEHIEIYAGSILVAAKNNPRGVPAIQESALMSEDMKFPGVIESKRLPRLQERVVLECVIQLLIEHGICIEHEGLLIFPSLFVSTETETKEEISHAISLYYDFSGAIDNIYSSLISAITVGEKFGAVRLWDNRAEFTKSGQGSCGLRKVSRQRGFAHLDVYVSDDTNEATRDLFVSVVEEHLARHGVEVYEHVEVTCSCSHQFNEATIRQRIADGHSEIGCPACDERVAISEGARQVRQKDPDIERSTWALRSQIRKLKDDAVARAKRNISMVANSRAEGPIRILHLSDLHITPLAKVDELLGPICADLRHKKNGLGIEKLDYLVVSGDVSDRGQQTEFEIARKLVSGIIAEFRLNAERCIIVPGNHDVNWDVDVYDWVPKRRAPRDLIGTRACLEQGSGYLLRNEAYADRLKSFSDNFYHTLIQKSYPLDPEKQAMEFFFPDDGLQFLCLNSCWEIDEHFPHRSSVNGSAVAECLRQADRIVRQNSPSLSNVFRIGVWHHPVTGNEKIHDDAFLSQLQQVGVKLALHGHVHEDRADLVGYVHPPTSLYVAGAGAFAAPAKARPESTPRLYNVIELERNLGSAVVHTRCLRKNGGAWEGWAVWPGNNNTERRSFYQIKF